MLSDDCALAAATAREGVGVVPSLSTAGPSLGECRGECEGECAALMACLGEDGS